jgi:hypothetical protein
MQWIPLVSCLAGVPTLSRLEKSLGQEVATYSVHGGQNGRYLGGQVWEVQYILSTHYPTHSPWLT